MNVIKQLEERERNIIFDEEEKEIKVNNIIKELEEREKNKILKDEDKEIKPKKNNSNKILEERERKIIFDEDEKVKNKTIINAIKLIKKLEKRERNVIFDSNDEIKPNNLLKKIANTILRIKKLRRVYINLLKPRFHINIYKIDNDKIEEPENKIEEVIKY